VREGLAQGTITKQEVLEMEKMMGMDLGQVNKMMGGRQVDKAKLREMGPDFLELLELFKVINGCDNILIFLNLFKYSLKPI
jgi:hypothetical protein